MIYVDELAEEAKAAWWVAHCDPATASLRNGGAHFSYLEGLLKKNGTGFAVGGDLTVADILVREVAGGERLRVDRRPRRHARHGMA